jgi:hypothetical protein
MMNNAITARITRVNTFPLSIRDEIAEGAWERIAAEMINEMPFPSPR